MVSGARRVPPEAQDANHAQGAPFLPSRKRKPVGEHADVEAYATERQ